MPPLAGFTWDPDSPLARTPPESQKANSALRDYAFMGAGRSLLKLHARYLEATGARPPTTRLAALKTWSMRYDWVSRVSAWDRARALEEEAEWLARRREVRAQDWNQGTELRSLAERIAAEGPSFIKTRRKRIPGSPQVVDEKGKVLSPGTPDQEIITMALDGNLMIRAAQTGSALQRLAAEMETERRSDSISVSGSLAVRPDIDLSGMEDDQLAAALARIAAVSLEIASRKSVPGNSVSPAPADPDREEQGTANA